MRKICAILVVVMAVGFVGCKKSAPTDQPVTEQSAQSAAAETQKAVQETAAKTMETAKPAAEEVKQALITAAAEVDLTSPIDKLKEQAKQMTVDALKTTAEKYKAQFLSTKKSMETKTDLLSKIPMAEKLGAEAQSLTKDIQTLTSTLASLKDRMAVYVNVLKAQGIDISGFAL
ncbi:MAG: hypothetical protein FJ263_07230 [Planctomycetes bacterium]|nr:hypothetical protein [Planctomycetota bacterium]